MLDIWIHQILYSPKLEFSSISLDVSDGGRELATPPARGDSTGISGVTGRAGVDGSAGAGTRRCLYFALFHSVCRSDLSFSLLKQPAHNLRLLKMSTCRRGLPPLLMQPFSHGLRGMSARMWLGGGGQQCTNAIVAAGGVCVAGGGWLAAHSSAWLCR